VQPRANDVGAQPRTNVARTKNGRPRHEGRKQGFDIVGEFGRMVPRGGMQLAQQFNGLQREGLKRKRPSVRPKRRRGGFPSRLPMSSRLPQLTFGAMGSDFHPVGVLVLARYPCDWSKFANRSSPLRYLLVPTMTVDRLLLAR
jgi:hypothetical protein